MSRFALQYYFEQMLKTSDDRLLKRPVPKRAAAYRAATVRERRLS